MQENVVSLMTYLLRNLFKIAKGYGVKGIGLRAIESLCFNMLKNQAPG